MFYLMSGRFAAEALSSPRAETEILVTRFKSIGDILFVLPAVHALREYFPSARITFLTSKENKSLIEGFGGVDEIITVDRSAFQRGRLGIIARETFSLLRTFRRRKFSLAIDLQGYGETALLTWLTRAPQRWGCVYREARGLAYTHAVKRDRSLHPVDWNLSLLQQCGVRISSVRNEFTLPESAASEARKVFAQLKLDTEKPGLFIQPFTSTPRKNWPLKNYLALANHSRERGVQVLFGGAPTEHAALEPAARAGFPISAGTPLLVSAGLMKLCTVIVGGDTGLLHLALAMKKRVVCLASANRPCLYGHPEWNIWPPDGVNVTTIAVETVADACAEAFAAERAVEAVEACRPH